MRSAVSAATRTSLPLRTLLAVWKLTPARAATSLIDTYLRRAIAFSRLAVVFGRTFAQTLNPLGGHRQGGSPRYVSVSRHFTRNTPLITYPGTRLAPRRPGQYLAEQGSGCLEHRIVPGVGEH